MQIPPIYVLRHGETEWNRDARWQGRRNSPLTALGRDQAAQQGRLLEGLCLPDFDIRVSPQGRAFQTAAIALAAQVDSLVTDERLCEIDVGAWTGRLRHALQPSPGPIEEDTPDGPLALYAHAPNGEGFARLRQRCSAFLSELRRPTICVTHGITSRMLRAIALDQPTAKIGDLPGGQGVIHIVEDGVHRTLS
ncbi:MAG: histidine phosphatase family protein [Pseudomonadota bacterium]